jgi:diacylglycerol kinase family enzyme
MLAGARRASDTVREGRLGMTESNPAAGTIGVPPSTLGQRMLARAAFAAVAAAVVVLIVTAGVKSFSLLIISIVAPAAMLALGFWFLVNRGVLRWLALAGLLLIPVAVIALFVGAGLLLETVVAIILAAVGLLAAAAALAKDHRDAGMPIYETPPPRRPFLIMNPHSGGGKVGRFGLKERAEALGAEVALIEGPGTVDIAALAQDAVARGADLLGVAGGDGTQALVAGIAAQHDLPFLVISAGTRNHFALDLGLDREDPARCLDALSDGVELVVDLGVINSRTFVNNASFGAYADVVQSPAYRDHKTATALDMLPDLMTRRRGTGLVVHADGATIRQPQAVLISNNPYGTTDLTGLGRRPRLDEGQLGVIGVSVRSARQAAGLLRRAHDHGLTRLMANEVILEADVPDVPVGVDGEALIMTAPVRCCCVRHALRVRVPRHRPGVPAPRPRLDWVRLRQLAASGKGSR